VGKIVDRGVDGGDKYRWQTIAELVVKNDWKRGAELGVWYGETFKYLIKNCPSLTLFGVDLYEQQSDNDGPQKYYPGEDGHKWEHEKYYKDVLKFCESSNGRATIYKGKTTDAANLIEDESLDFVFIDADHSFKGVDEDILYWAPKVRQGGYIIGHDIHWPTVKGAVEKHFGNDYLTSEDFIWYVIK
jgi:hypothetical protein